MAKAIFTIETRGVDTSIKSVEDLEKELESLRDEFRGVAIGSERFEELGNQIKSTETKLKNIDLQFESLDKEQRLSAIGDAFGGLIGTIGLATGTLVAFGIESEKLDNVERRLAGLLTAVVSFKEAQEGLIAVQKLVNVQFKAFSNIIKANPIGAVATAIVAITSAIYLYNQAQKEATAITEDNTDALEKQEAQLARNISLRQQELTLLRINGADAIEIAEKTAEFEKQNQLDRINLRKQLQDEEARLRAFLNVGSDEAKARTAENIQRIQDEISQVQGEIEKGRLQQQVAEATLTATIKREEENRTKTQLDELEKRRQAREKEINELREFYYNALNLQREVLNELTILNQEEIDAILDANAKSLVAKVGTTYQAGRNETEKTTKQIIQQAQDTLLANAELAEQVVGSSVAVAGQLASTLGDAVDDGSEKGFNASKKYKIAEVITSAIQGGFQAFTTSLSSFPAPIGAIVGAAQVASIAIASRRAIGEIQSSTYQNPNSGAGASTSISTPSVPAPSSGGSFQGGTGFLTPQVAPSTPTPAYVVAGDVQNGLQALNELNTRRRFG